MIKSIVGRYLAAVEDTMQAVVRDYLRDEPGYGVMLRYAMGWVDENGNPYTEMTGKRLRPTLLLLCNETSGGNWQTALPAAAAVELLHNFSLIHDDIQDDSETRHNRPTVWKLWGKPIAINAGDALYTLSYAALQELSESLAADDVLSAWRIFNGTSLELTRGQHLDMRFETQETVTVDEYISMISGKSAALLSTCARLGAFIATTNETTAQHYADFGLNIGIAFQIRDDILGIWGDPDITGKSAATDIISQKKSLPILYGLAQSDELSEMYRRSHLTDEDVQRAVSLLNALDAKAYTREKELAYYDKAMQALDTAQPQGNAAERLHTFVNFLFQRTY